MKIVCLLTVIILVELSWIVSGRDGVFDGIYEFKMYVKGILSGKVTRTIRVYLCPYHEKIYLSMTDYKPSKGFGEFTFGLAVFNDDASPQIEPDVLRFNMESQNGIIIGDFHLFVDAKYTLRFKSIYKGDTKTTLSFEYDDDGEIIDQQYTLKRVRGLTNTGLIIKEKEMASKCWIPYKNKQENIQSIHKNGMRSIWKTDKLPKLNVYDMDILNDNGDNKGCWSWVNQNGIGIEAANIGTAGGNNFNYKYEFDDNLLIVQWIDDGSWITFDTRSCHYGTSIFMIIAKDKAVSSFICSDEVTGDQFIMYKQPLSDDIKCPLLKNKEKKKDKTEL